MAAPTDLQGLLRLLSERAIPYTQDEAGDVHLGTTRNGDTQPASPGGDALAREPPYGASFTGAIGLYRRMGWAFMLAQRTEVDVVNEALQILNGTGIDYQWKDYGAEGYLFALPLGDVPSQPTPSVKTHKPGDAEMRLRNEGWTVLATYSCEVADDHARALDVLAQHALVEWRRTQDGGCFLLAARPAPDGPAARAGELQAAREGRRGVEDAELAHYYRAQGYAVLTVPAAEAWSCFSLIRDFQKRGLDIRYEQLGGPSRDQAVQRYVLAVRCAARPGREAAYGGERNARDDTLRRDGYAVLVTFDGQQAATVRSTLERMGGRRLPLRWTEEDEESGTRFAARLDWPPPADGERTEGDDAVALVDEDEANGVRYDVCRGLRDLSRAGLGVQWRLCDDVVTVSPWDAF